MPEMGRQASSTGQRALKAPAPRPPWRRPLPRDRPKIDSQPRANNHQNVLYLKMTSLTKTLAALDAWIKRGLDDVNQKI
ncbi:MAG: hypothetical protein RLY65_1401 [Pseudomonadota bacterium]